MLCGVVFDRSKQFGSAPIVTARPAIAEFKKSDLDASWRCREYVPAALSGVETRPLSDKAIWLANSSHSSRDTQRGDICARRLQRRLITLGVQSDLDTTVTWLQENRGKDAYALAMLYSNESCGRLDFAKVVNNYARAHKGGDRRSAAKLAALLADFLDNEVLAVKYSEVAANQPNASAWALYRHARYQQKGICSAVDFKNAA